MKDFKFNFEPEIIKAKTSEEKGSLIVWAYASTYDVDSDDCQITREALERAKDDLLTYSTVLFNHDTNRPVGKVVETRIDNKGLLVKVVLSKTEADLMAKISDGTISKLSIGGRAYEMEYTIPDEKGRTILQITNIKLFEVSFVPVPANSEAKTISSSFAKSLVIKMMNDDESDTQKSLLADLQILSGRLTGDNKAVVDKVLGFFKSENISMKKELQYDFDDTATDRPVFQTNLSDEASIELGEGNTFKKQILKKGKWYHWSADNGVLNITDAKIDTLIKNFKANTLDSVPVPLTHSNNPLDNAGQVKELIKTEDGLDAVIEIKDESVLEKIKDGLITAISASVDPNYLLKKTKKFVGPTLLHAALVAEPYIKGMTGFVALGDEFDGRAIISLEDSEPDVRVQLQLALKLLSNIQKQMEGNSEDDDTTEGNDNNEEVDEGTTEEDIEKAKKGDKCKTKDGAAGVYAEDKDGKMVCKPTKKSIGDEGNSSTEDSSDETEVDDVSTEGTEEGKSEEVVMTDVDLSDATKLYNGYLKDGKLVPAQKEPFMKLCEAMKAIQLADSTVDVKGMLNNFIQSQPKLVNFSEDGGVDDGSGESTETDTADGVEIPKDVKNFYMDKMNMSEESAIKSWEDAKKMNDAESTRQSTIFE